jgi:hypothetical protein
LRVLLDGSVLVDLHDATLASGAVALYAGATASCRFAALTVDAAEPSWMTYHEFAGDEPLAAGRRVRLFAGTAADLTLAPQSSEVRRFQGFATTDPWARRLPAEGVDLRLVAPSGDVMHAHRFAPDAADATATAVRLLRATDGTGAVLVRSADSAAGSRFAPGDYRLTWTFRRDNRTADPGSPLLSEAGDTSDEVVRIFIPVR